MKAWPTLGIIIVESILFAGHFFVYRTWIAFHGGVPPGDSPGLFALVLALAFSFTLASLRFWQPKIKTWQQPLAQLTQQFQIIS